MPKRCPPKRLFAAPGEILCEIHKPVKTYRFKNLPHVLFSNISLDFSIVFHMIPCI